MMPTYEPVHNLWFRRDDNGTVSLEFVVPDPDGGEPVVAAAWEIDYLPDRARDVLAKVFDADVSVSDDPPSSPRKAGGRPE